MGKEFRPLILLQLGFIVVSSILLSLFLGLWVDDRFGTAPWGVLAGIVVGVLAGTVGVVRLVAKVIKEVSDQEDK
ncbi:MAG: AtpZ/AtpI family protein [Chloroflexota bacterium]